MDASETTQLLRPELNGNGSKDPLEAQAKELGVTPFQKGTAVAVCLNYIIGTGCFGLPYAFTATGLGLTSLLLLVGSVCAFISLNYTLEIVTRGEGATSAEEERSSEPVMEMSYRKFGFTTLAYKFSGSTLQNITQLVMTCYAMGTLWLYSSIFSSSVSAIFFSYVLHTECDVYAPIHSNRCEASYYVCMAIFATIVITLGLQDLGDQAVVQKLLSLYRVVAFVIMITTLIVKIAVNPNFVPHRVDDIGYFDWKKFALGFGPCMLAITCQYNIPDVIQPLQDKRAAKQVTFIALFASVVLYFALGLLGALAFEHVNPLVTLNWNDYTACGDGWEPCPRNYFANAIQLIVMLFPVVNVTSSYPLVSITLGDNIMGMLPAAWSEKYGAGNVKTGSRLVCLVPPLILATFFKKIEIIFTLSGMFGFVLSLVLPCALQVASLDYCTRTFGNIKSSITPYSVDIISERKFSNVMFWVSTVITGVAVVTFFLPKAV
ncbi:hypothetical protein SARC_05781 [Sphaeroforma arctica JP610]|uniref:Amino acid transporter transmembrane domain-containing protein n=1 Tax=Sphaeroforma arctica JP610 TaxID=667725 RepID=A0A0L0FZE4_9EUKA|nr:hypothetical protein SARC_05781 [Sphaeroforma arctica JP610]KNC81931.1 hypothetical protein SARC_05781 [Sphaeroforma arctica JP610]|eukprot:XP_014155833.1 hypothetical protein SARC_05781 [Sphaeroforma arctica JP610]